MSVRALVTGLVVPLALLAGCGSTSPPTSGGGSSSSSTPPPVAAGQACSEVRAGIAAFNQADYAGTVDHFKTAEPLAEKVIETDSSQSAADLLEAIRYYADLAPDDYPAAAIGSPDFAKYKAITLGQCTSPATEPPDDGAPAQPA